MCICIHTCIHIQHCTYTDHMHMNCLILIYTRKDKQTDKQSLSLGHRQRQSRETSGCVSAAFWFFSLHGSCRGALLQVPGCASVWVVAEAPSGDRRDHLSQDVLPLGLLLQLGDHKNFCSIELLSGSYSTHTPFISTTPSACAEGEASSSFKLFCTRTCAIATLS